LSSGLASPLKHRYAWPMAGSKQKKMRLTAALIEDDGLYVAQCIEVDVASQGETVEKALANLKEALELYFEDGAEPPPKSTPIIAPVEVTLSETN